MAALTTTRAGDWANTTAGVTPWTALTGSGSGGVPGIGDTVTISHNVTISSSVTVGHSPAAADGTAAILVSGAAVTLTLSSGTLTVRGDIKLNAAALTLSAGTILEFDASAASSPSTARYVLQISTAGSQHATCQLNVNGSVGNRVTIRSNAGGANARINGGGFTGGGKLNCNHFEMLRLGDSSNDAITFNPSSGAGAFFWTLKNGVADSCGRILQASGGSAAEVITFENVSTKNSTHATESARFLGVTSGVNRCVGNVTDKILYIINNTGWSVTDCILLGGMTASSGIFVAWTRNFYYNTASSSGIYDPDCSISDSFFAAISTNTNAHYLKASSSRDVTIDGIIFEHLGTSVLGDCLMPGSPGTARTATFQNCIKLPNADGGSSGCFFSGGGNANSINILNKNTIHLGGARDSSGIRYGEAYAGHAGMFSSIRSNAFWDTSARGYKVHPLTPPGPDNVVAGGNCNYNGGALAEMLTGVSGKGYDQASTVTPGANDLDENPKFADPTRKLATWDASLGGPGTSANAMAELAKRNDATGYNPAYNVPALMNWIRRGFAPRNLKYATAGHDGGRIGAIEPILPFGHLGG